MRLLRHGRIKVRVERVRVERVRVERVKVERVKVKELERCEEAEEQQVIFHYSYSCSCFNTE